MAEVLEAVGSPQPSSGAGAAGALALALAAACARKAVGVTRKRADTEALRDAEERLVLQQHRAVTHAHRDALLFKAYLQNKQSREAANLVEAAQGFLQLVNDVGNAVDGVAEHVTEGVAGDITAARSLHRAAADIGQDLLGEAKSTRAD